jgi:hypothetical protein
VLSVNIVFVLLAQVYQIVLPFLECSIFGRLVWRRDSFYDHINIQGDSRPLYLQTVNFPKPALAQGGHYLFES